MQAFLLVLINGVFYMEIISPVAGNSCDSNMNCTDGSICCRGINVSSSGSCLNESSCFGRYCTSDIDCSGINECCRKKKCAVCAGCSKNSDCGSLQFCCNSDLKGESHCKSRCFEQVCKSREDCSPRECCISSRCANCLDPETPCYFNAHCGPGKYCCGKPHEQARCSSSCIGSMCSNDSHCGQVDQCCHSGKCVKCSDPGCKLNSVCNNGQHCCHGKCCRSNNCTPFGCFCTSHSDCMSGKYCCQTSKYSLFSQCRSSCIGAFCNENSNCGEGECCRSHKCVNCLDPGCSRNSHCGIGNYCCRRDVGGEGVCNTSCVGQPCDSFDRLCGRPDECCLERRCVKCGFSCTSNSDCFSGAYCCGQISYQERKCSSSCLFAQCLNDSDCGQPHRNTVCYLGTCSFRKIECEDCYSHYCDSDNDCKITDECCGSEGICTTSGCSKNEGLPLWLIVVLAGSLIMMCSVLFIIKLRHYLQLHQAPSHESFSLVENPQYFHETGEQTRISATQTEEPSDHHDPCENQSDTNSTNSPSAPPPSYDELFPS